MSKGNRSRVLKNKNDEGECKVSYLDNDKCTEKRVAREILSIIEKICFSDEFSEYRVNNGSNGERGLIIESIKERYQVS